MSGVQILEALVGSAPGIRIQSQSAQRGGLFGRLIDTQAADIRVVQSSRTR